MPSVAEHIKGFYQADEDARRRAREVQQRKDEAARRRAQRELSISILAMRRSLVETYLKEMNRDLLVRQGVLFRNGGELKYHDARGVEQKANGVFIELMWASGSTAYKITALALGTTLRIYGRRTARPTNPDLMDDLLGPEPYCASVSLVEQYEGAAEEIKLQLANTYYALVS